MDNLIVALTTCGATIFFIVVLRPLAISVGLVDHPDERKRHADSVPLVGGIAIFCALLVSALIGIYYIGALDVVRSGVVVFLLAALVLVVVGVLDDMRGLTPRVRILAQIAVSLLMVYGGGIVIVDLGGISLTGATLFLGVLAVPFTVFVVVGLINAVNMADGLDGLVGNMSLVTLLGLGMAESMWGTTGSPTLINVLSSAVIGFLVFNQRVFWRARAAVFLGDAGSMMLGFALAWTTIEMSQGLERTISPIAAVWFMAVPVCDTLSVMARRALAGQSPFHADSRHLHHLFIQIGFSVTQTIVIMCALAAAGVAVGLAATWLGASERAMLLLFVLTWVACFALSSHAWKTRRFLGRDFHAEQPAY